MLTDELLAKLAPYAESDKSDEVIALVEDLPVEAVTAWRASLSATPAPDAAPEGTPEPAPEMAPDATTKPKGKEPKADKPKPAKPAAPAPAPEPNAPASVIVTARGIQLGQHLGPFPRSPRRHDVYHGEQAALLWKHYRSFVEPCPKA